MTAPREHGGILTSLHGLRVVAIGTTSASGCAGWDGSDGRTWLALAPDAASVDELDEAVEALAQEWERLWLGRYREPDVELLQRVAELGGSWPVEPAPLPAWDASWAGTRGQWSLACAAARAAKDAYEVECRDLLSLLREELLGRYGLRAAQMYVPSRWMFVYDEGCRCAHVNGHETGSVAQVFVLDGQAWLAPVGTDVAAVLGRAAAAGQRARAEAFAERLAVLAQMRAELDPQEAAELADPVVSLTAAEAARLAELEALEEDSLLFEQWSVRRQLRLRQDRSQLSEEQALLAALPRYRRRQLPDPELRRRSAASEVRARAGCVALDDSQVEALLQALPLGVFAVTR